MFILRISRNFYFQFTKLPTTNISDWTTQQETKVRFCEQVQCSVWKSQLEFLSLSVFVVSVLYKGIWHELFGSKIVIISTSCSFVITIYISFWSLRLFSFLCKQVFFYKGIDSFFALIDVQNKYKCLYDKVFWLSSCKRQSRYQRWLNFNVNWFDTAIDICKVILIQVVTKVDQQNHVLDWWKLYKSCSRFYLTETG